MLSDEAWDIYTHRLYLKDKRKTYMMSSRIDFFQKIAKIDTAYQKLSEIVTKSAQHTYDQPA
jgi:uncharacterized protein (DUF2235 family)